METENRWPTFIGWKWLLRRPLQQCELLDLSRSSKEETVMTLDTNSDVDTSIKPRTRARPWLRTRRLIPGTSLWRSGVTTRDPCRFCWLSEYSFHFLMIRWEQNHMWNLNFKNFRILKSEKWCHWKWIWFEYLSLLKLLILVLMMLFTKEMNQYTLVRKYHILI